MGLHLTGPTVTQLNNAFARLVGVQAVSTSSSALVVGSHNPFDASGGNLTPTLADAPSAGLMVAASKKDSSTNTVAIQVAHLRDQGAQTFTLVGQHEAVVFESKADGTWWPMADHKTKAYFDATYIQKPTTDPGDWRLLRRDTADVSKGVAWTTAQQIIARALGWTIVTDPAYGAVGDGTTDNATAFAAVATAVNAMSGTDPVSVFFPDGTYVYTSGLAFTRPVRLASSGATLNYTGTGYAVKLGPDGLSVNNYGDKPYTVEGLQFTGGASMSQGIFANSFVTIVRVIDCEFYNFGNATAYDIWLNGNNWDSLIRGCTYYANGSVAMNWVKSNAAGINATRMRILGCVATNQTTTRGVGVWIDGANCEVADCKIEGFAPNVHIGKYGQYTSIVDSYFEVPTNTGCIQYGDTGDATYTNKLTVRNVYANMHNTDFGNTSYFLQPTDTVNGLQNTTLQDINVVNSNRELVKQNNLASQNGNRATNVSGYSTGLFTYGTSVNPWLLDLQDSGFTAARLVATTANATLVTLRATRVACMYQIGFYFQVATAPTDVDLFIWHTDGTFQTTHAYTGTAVAVGRYTVASITIPSDGTNDLILLAKVGTANQVTVNAWARRIV